MKKLFFYAASAAMVLASCSSDDFVGENNGSPGGNVEAITFGSGVPATTRADATGGTAAEKLHNTFYVYGIKNETTDGAGDVQGGNLVYNNYKVTWTENTAFTTTSNTEDWEYVGLTLTEKEQAKITANSGNAAQTIKYWDWGATDYTFYAFSALSADIEGDKVTVVKKQTETSGVYDNGYTVTLAAGASLDNLYFSERLPITKSTNTNRVQPNVYGGLVQFRFHNVGTRVRVAMYETIPGYSVKINSFKTQNSATPTFADMSVESTTNFTANFVNNGSGTAGTLTVTYDGTTGSPTLNYPKTSFAPTGDAANVLTLGTEIISATSLGTTSTGATYDKTGGAYTTVFPKEGNTQNLKLKVCYTLTAPNTGEIITVTDATAEIPADYLKWKPGYAYTYIFKISDNTNGSTGTPGTDPAGLYPITFDAVVAESTDGIQETITTVSEPTITTFGYNSSTKVYTSGTDEYPVGSDIYAVIMAGSSVVEPTLNTNVKIYSVTTSDATNFPITEASVAESLSETSVGTKKFTAADVTSTATGIFSAAPESVTSVPGEDGNTKTINAVKLTGVTAGTYAIEYTAGSAWTGTTYTKIYKIIKVQ